MKIIAYSYTDPLLESPIDPTIWGWELDQVYEDLGNRTELEKLFNECQIEKVDYLLVRRLRELGDTLFELNANLEKLQSLGITLITIEQDYNSTKDHANPSVQLIKLLQETQYEQHSRRIRQGHARNRLEASPPPGKAPYGYKRGRNKYILDRSSSPIVKDFFEHFLLYGSLRGSVQNIAKKYGKRISVTTGHRWLTNSIYRGDTAYRDGEIISDTHAAIISRQEAAQVDRLLRRNSRLPSRTASAPRSLAGLVICGECQSHMTVTRVTTRNKKKEYIYLRPINCPKHPKCSAISYQEILEHTIEKVCHDLPIAVAKMDFPQLEALKSNLGEAVAHEQKVLTQLPSLVETGILDTDTAKLRAYKIRTEISALQAKLLILPPVNLRSVAQLVSIPQFWLDLSESERRFYFREFISQILIVRQEDQWKLQIIFIF